MTAKQPTTHEERRRFLRHELGESRILPVRPAGALGVVYECRAENFSRGGCRIHGVLPATPGDFLELEMDFLERRLFVTARVVRVSHWPGQLSGHWSLEFISPAYAECSVCGSKFASSFFSGDEASALAACPTCRPPNALGFLNGSPAYLGRPLPASQRSDDTRMESDTRPT